MPTGIPKSGKRKKKVKVIEPVGVEYKVGVDLAHGNEAMGSTEPDIYKDMLREQAIESAIEKVVSRRVDKLGEYWTKCLDDPVVLSCPEVVGLLRRGEFLIWCVNEGRLRIRESETMKTELGHMVTYYDRMEQ